MSQKTESPSWISWAGTTSVWRRIRGIASQVIGRTGLEPVVTASGGGTAISVGPAGVSRSTGAGSGSGVGWAGARASGGRGSGVGWTAESMAVGSGREEGWTAESMAVGSGRDVGWTADRIAVGSGRGVGCAGVRTTVRSGSGVSWTGLATTARSATGVCSSGSVLVRRGVGGGAPVGGGVGAAWATLVPTTSLAGVGVSITPAADGVGSIKDGGPTRLTTNPVRPATVKTMPSAVKKTRTSPSSSDHGGYRGQNLSSGTVATEAGWTSKWIRSMAPREAQGEQTDSSYQHAQGCPQVGIWSACRG